MSNDLIWELVKGNNRFLVKRDGVTFSKEKGNLMARNSRQFSGLANSRVVHIGSRKTKTKKGVVSQVGLELKRDRSARKPSNFSSCSLRKHIIKGNCVGAATVRRVVEKQGYRPDLARFAVARYHRMRQLLNTKRAMKKEEKKGAKAPAPKAAAAAPVAAK